MTIESSDQYEGVARAGRVVAVTLQEVADAVAQGVTTGDLDAVARDVFARYGARSAPALVYGFPGCVLISLNDEAVHGVPGRRVISQRDLVKIDVTVDLDGFVADAAVTVPMPGAPPVARRLSECARLALDRGMRSARRGGVTRDIGRAVHSEVHRHDFRVLRELSGHGVGATIHETPSVPNWPAPWARTQLSEGLVITIEPIIAVSTEGCYTDRDGWVIRTADGSLSAHFEHTVVVRGERPEILTAA